MNFTLEFDLLHEAASLNIRLRAEAIFDSPKMIYHIRNIRIRNHMKVFPDFSIRKRGQEWIDIDCRKANRMSSAIGAAIDRRYFGPKTASSRR